MREVRVWRRTPRRTMHPPPFRSRHCRLPAMLALSRRTAVEFHFAGMEIAGGRATRRARFDPAALTVAQRTLPFARNGASPIFTNEAASWSWSRSTAATGTPADESATRPRGLAGSTGSPTARPKRIGCSRPGFAPKSREPLPALARRRARRITRHPSEPGTYGVVAPGGVDRHEPAATLSRPRMRPERIDPSVHAIGREPVTTCRTNSSAPLAAGVLRQPGSSIPLK